jgi:hypothetical protein
MLCLADFVEILNAGFVRPTIYKHFIPEVSLDPSLHCGVAQHTTHSLDQPTRPSSCLQTRECREITADDVCISTKEKPNRGTLQTQPARVLVSAFEPYQTHARVRSLFPKEVNTSLIGSWIHFKHEPTCAPTPQPQLHRKLMDYLCERVVSVPDNHLSVVSSYI